MEEQEDHNEAMEVNSDSDDSSSEDDEVQRALMYKAECLEKELADNKYAYESHYTLVHVYRQLGDLNSMREAYKRFHEYYPLTPEIWLQWIEDEKKLATSENETKYVLSLFEKAVDDYLSVNLWVEYAQYSIGGSTLDVTRQIIEKGLTAAGLHAADGSLLWDTLRELEYAHLGFTEPGTDPWKEQVAKIVEVFRRQLSVPLLDMDNTYKEWKEWLEQLPEGHAINAEPIEWGYAKARKVLDTYIPFEDKLHDLKDEEKLLETYREYVKAVKDPSTVLCIYERAVAQMCLNPAIWLDYCLYALKFGETALKVSSKALRNCTWDEELWVTKLRILEHLAKEEKEIIAVFEQGLATLGAQCSEFWFTYLEYVQRNSENKDKLYKSFDQALQHLRDNVVGNAKLTMWYARLLAKDDQMSKARQLWKTLIKNPSHKGVGNLWLEYIALEKQFGDVAQARTAYQRAVQCCSESAYIADQWLMFEREYGKLADVMKCAEKRREIVKTTPQPEVVSTAMDLTTTKGEKRKLATNAKAEPEQKKSRQEPPRKKRIVKDPKITVFVSNLHTNVDEKRLKKVFPNAENIEVVKDSHGKTRCYGYVQFKMEEEAAVALARDRELVDGRPIFISTCKPDRTQRKASFKYSQDTEGNKLFVKGLPYATTEDEIKGIFEAYDVKEVRLIRHRDGQSKGIAYVEFNDEEKAKEAMRKTDQIKIGEHTITVNISAPPKKYLPNKPIARPANPPTHAKRKITVPLIPRQIASQMQGASSANGADGAAQVQSKTNADFRNMLFKN